MFYPKYKPNKNIPDEKEELFPKIRKLIEIMGLGNYFFTFITRKERILIKLPNSIAESRIFNS